MQDWPWGHWCHGCPRGVLVPQLGLQVRALQEGMEEHGGAFGSQIQPSQGRSGKMGSLPASQQPHQGKGWPQDRAGTSPQQGREAGARAGREWGAGGRFQPHTAPQRGAAPSPEWVPGPQVTSSKAPCSCWKGEEHSPCQLLGLPPAFIEKGEATMRIRAQEGPQHPSSLPVPPRRPPQASSPPTLAPPGLLRAKLGAMQPCLSQLSLLPLPGRTEQFHGCSPHPMPPPAAHPPAPFLVALQHHGAAPAPHPPSRVL